MSRFSFVHTADLHLDTPFEGVGRVPPHVADALRDASLDAWDAVVDLVLARDAAALLVAGGLCDAAARGARAQARFRAGLDRLAARGVCVCVALGDRDRVEDWPALHDGPAGVTVFAGGAVGAVTLRRAGAPLATIYGVSAAPGRAGENLGRHVARGTAAGLHIGVLHARVGGGAAEAACSPCTIEDLRGAGIDYWALGHEHEHAVLGTGDPWIVYPGTPQGRGLAAAECGAKGVVVAEVDGEAIARVDVEPVDRVRCLPLDVDASGLDAAALRGVLTEGAGALRAAHPGRALLVEGRVRGDAPAVRALRQPDRREALLREVRRDAESWTPFLWWSGLRLAGPVADALRRGDDLAAEVARRRAALAGEPEHSARFLARRFEPLRCVWTAELEAREAADVLDDAEALAIDLLAGGNDR